MKRSLHKFIIVLFLIGSVAYPQSKLGLPFGKFNVGFKRVYTFDTSRNYPMQWIPDENNDTILSARPMVINIWYPCQEDQVSSFSYQDYISFKSPSKSWDNFLSRLGEFNKQIIKSNAFSYTGLEDKEQENTILDSLFNISLSVNNNATQVVGARPLIIYHQALGGSIEENATSAEFFASHGYVVINAAYQSEKGKIMHPDWDLEKAKCDIDFLINYAEASLEINNDNIHFIGFSFGAQAMYNYLFNENNIKSFISLDSRMEYSFNLHPRGYKDLPQRFYDGHDNYTTPTLSFTSPQASYKIIDTLKNADKYYVMIPNQRHYDFASIRQWAYLLASKLEPNEVYKRRKEVFKYNHSLMLDFINSYSEGSSYVLPIGEDSLGYLYDKALIGQGNSSFSSIEDIKSPKHVIKAYELGLSSLIIDHRKELDKYIYEGMLNNYGYSILKDKETNAAVEVFKFAIELFPKSSNLYDSLGEAYYQAKDYDRSKHSYKKSLELDPSNKNAAEYLEKISLIILNSKE